MTAGQILQRNINNLTNTLYQMDNLKHLVEQAVIKADGLPSQGDVIHANLIRTVDLIKRAMNEQRAAIQRLEDQKRRMFRR